MFEQINKLKAKLRADGVDIIDLGMGNPDLPPPEHVIEKLIETARRRTCMAIPRRAASRAAQGIRRLLRSPF